MRYIKIYIQAGNNFITKHWSAVEVLPDNKGLDYIEKSCKLLIKQFKYKYRDFVKAFRDIRYSYKWEFISKETFDKFPN